MGRREGVDGRFSELERRTGNAVVLENCYPGSNGWRLIGTDPVGNGGVAGFATAASINKGDSVNLKIDGGAAATYSIGVYRLGPVIAALFMNLMPISAILITAALGVLPSWQQIIGGIVVLVGIMLAQLRRG